MQAPAAASNPACNSDAPPTDPGRVELIGALLQVLTAEERARLSEMLAGTAAAPAKVER